MATKYSFEEVEAMVSDGVADGHCSICDCHARIETDATTAWCEDCNKETKFNNPIYDLLGW